MELKYLIFLFFLFLPFVGAVHTPFTQCVRVIDPDGNPMSGLTCYFNDEAGFHNDSGMTASGNNYCLNVNSSYAEGEHFFRVTCTDGILNRSVYDSFSIGSTDVGGYPATGSFVPSDEPIYLGFWSYMKENPAITILIFFGVSAITNIFYRIAKVRRLKRK